MLGLKKYLVGGVVGLLLGLWWGVNLGKDRPLWSNPFREPTLAEKARAAAGGVLRDAKKAVRESLADD